MNQKLITIVGILAALVFGGMVFWALTLPEPTQEPISTEPGQTGGVFYRGTVSVNAPGQGTTPGELPPIPELRTAYDVLFHKLLAQRVEFKRVQSATGAEASVYALYAADIAEARKNFPQMTDFSLGIAMVDVTDDGVLDALVYEDFPGSCGTAGCLFVVYQRSGQSWTRIFEAQAQGEVGLANVITNGHIDLYVTQQGGVNYAGVVKRYTWSGEGYRATDIVAYWDGSKFVVGRR